MGYLFENDKPFQCMLLSAVFKLRLECDRIHCIVTSKVHGAEDSAFRNSSGIFCGTMFVCFGLSTIVFFY